MGHYFRTPEMMTGQGFRCPNCWKLLALKIKAPSDIAFKCPRCKAYVRCIMKEPVPWAVIQEEFNQMQTEHQAAMDQSA